MNYYSYVLMKNVAMCFKILTFYKTMSVGFTVAVIIIFVWYLGFMILAAILNGTNHPKFAKSARSLSIIYPLNGFITELLRIDTL